MSSSSSRFSEESAVCLQINVEVTHKDGIIVVRAELRQKIQQRRDWTTSKRAEI
jgi:hypothetical protein